MWVNGLERELESCGALTVKISGCESSLRDTIGSPCSYRIGRSVLTFSMSRFKPEASLGSSSPCFSYLYESTEVCLHL